AGSGEDDGAGTSLAIPARKDRRCMTPPPSDTWDTATVRRQTRSVKQRSGELTCRKSGVQVNEVKDLKPFQDRMAPTLRSRREQGGQGVDGQDHGCGEGGGPHPGGCGR